MICPNCKNTLEVPDYAYVNARTYHDIVTVTTNCCQSLIYLKPITEIVVLKNDSGRLEDDWGNPVKKLR